MEWNKVPRTPSSRPRLRTDSFDLDQLHGIASLAEAEQALAPGGELETLVAAKRDGCIRSIGFSVHSEEAALWLLDRDDFDSILYPVNFVCYAAGDLGPSVLAMAQERGTARLALKVLAHTPLDLAVDVQPLSPDERAGLLAEAADFVPLFRRP